MRCGVVASCATRVFGYGAGGVGAQEDFNEVVFESLKFKAVAKANPSWLAAKGVVGEPDCPPAVAGGCALVRTTPHPSAVLLAVFGVTSCGERRLSTV